MRRIARAGGMSVALLIAAPAAADPLPDTLPSHGGEVVTHAVASTFGLRAGLTRVRYGDARASNESLVLSGRREEHGEEHGVLVDVANVFAIGGGPDGIEGQLGLNLAGGLRAPVAKDHGPMTRVAAEGHIQGGPRLLHSLIEVPQLQLGYQYFAAGRLAELGMKTGYVLAGYYRADDVGRPLGASFEWGAFANINMKPLQLHGNLTRVIAGGPASSLDMFEAEICSRARSILVCSDARFFFGNTGDRSLGTLRDSRAVSFGVTLGFAQK